MVVSGLELVADVLVAEGPLPTTLICLMREALPSAMLMLMSTRLRSSGVTLVSMVTLYFAAVVVLAGQLLLHTVELQAVEGLAFVEADRQGPLRSSSSLTSLLPLIVIFGDGRTFLHAHHEDVALARELHVVEEAGLEQGANGLLRPFGGEGVALSTGR